MNIKTITTYQDYNYGASLQAYALQTYLIKRGHDAQLIRYEPEYLRRYYSFWYVNKESKLSSNIILRMIYRVLKWLHRMTTLKRKASFDYFNHKVIKETIAYKSKEELYNNPPVADLYICGSDQIWNILYDAGKDPVFYLDFVKSGKKASYAASFSYLDIPDDYLEVIQHFLSTFSAVSVREWQGSEICKKMGIYAHWVLDPVFLLSAQEWEKLMNRKDIITNERNFSFYDKYILVYDFELCNKEMETFVKRYAKQKKLHIYAIVDRFPLPYAEKNFKKCGPVDFIKLIRYCHVFVSNSFHGTAFSIIFHKPFFVFNRKRHKANSRMESLLKLFGLQNVLITNNIDAENAFLYSFDWNNVEKIKETNVVISKDYLRVLRI